MQDKHPEIVARLTKLLEKYVADGRSTPGAPQKNAGERGHLEGGQGGTAATTKIVLSEPEA